MFLMDFVVAERRVGGGGGLCGECVCVCVDSMHYSRDT
jgi:hypothetical protein